MPVLSRIQTTVNTTMHVEKILEPDNLLSQGKKDFRKTKTCENMKKLSLTT